MKASALPTKFPVPFANAAGGGYIRPIPTASQIGVANGAASLADGFPPLTFQPVGSGGTPPAGQDFNGILNQATAWNRWQAAGGLVPYDAAFSASIGGYPSGAAISSAVTSGRIWVSTADDNTTNPDGGTSANWVQLMLPSDVATSVNTFVLSKPASLIVWVDPVNGNDGNDGTLPSKSYKTLDAALAKTQSYALTIYLLGDVTWNLRQNLFNLVTIQGVTADASGNITGYTLRGVTLKGEANNSPLPQGRCTAGAFVYSLAISFSYCYIQMPDIPGGVAIFDHFRVVEGGNVNFAACTITTAGSAAGSLVGNPAGNAQAGGYFGGCTLSGTTPGHLFYTVSAGTNPNGVLYRSNLTSV